MFGLCSSIGLGLLCMGYSTRTLCDLYSPYLSPEVTLTEVNEKGVMKGDFITLIEVGSGILGI